MKFKRVGPGIVEDEDGNRFLTAGATIRLLRLPYSTAHHMLARGDVPCQAARTPYGRRTYLLTGVDAVRLAFMCRMDPYGAAQELAPLFNWTPEDILRVTFAALGYNWDEIKREMQEEPERFI